MDPLARISQPAPDFSLSDLDGKVHHLSDQLGRIVVLNFWSAGCPWMQRVDVPLNSLRSTWPQDVVYWPIASNANESLEEIAVVAKQRELPLVLLDGDQAIADLYGAGTTPHFFVIDRDGVLRYAGAYDDVSFRQRTPTRSFLEEAIVALLAGLEPDPSETPAYGCSLVRHSA
jgi:peroxiredoxin